MAFGKCESCATLRELIEAERLRYTDLLEKYHSLKLEGATNNAGIRGLEPATRSTKPADEAIETMMGRFGNNPLLRKRLQRYVNLQRQKNAEEDAIAHSVLHWSDPDADEDAA